VAERIGIYLCECGPNIKDAMDFDGVLKFVRGIEGVVLAKPHGFLCSEEGKALLQNDIKAHDLTRVVIAACSPKEHEDTFKQVLESAGLNPFLLQIANIREQCAWVIKDRHQATRAAKAIIGAAASRVIHHEPLEIEEIECRPDVLVVGAGIAGISAALMLTQKDRKVYLVEKSPCMGGKIALYEDLFPNLECASCVLSPKLDEVLHNRHIELMTLSQIREVLGSYGDFLVKVDKRARYIDQKTCIGCGACLDVCPVSVRNEYNEGLNERRAIYIPYAGSLPNVAVIDREHCLRWQGKECALCMKACPFGSIDYDETDQIRELRVGAIVLATGFDMFDPSRAPQYGYGKIENVYTAPEFERLLNSTGPTGGKILLKNGSPPSKIILIHCVGSRTSKYSEHCSGVCCMYSLKFAHQAMQKLSGVTIVELFSDLCLPGKEGQRFFNMVKGEKGLELIRMKDPDAVEVIEEGGNIVVKFVDPGGEVYTVTSDMVVLSPAIECASDAQNIIEVFDIARGEEGFFTEDHPQTDPVSTSRKGIFIAGCAQGPKDIQGSVAQGQAAAGEILSRLVPGEKLVIEAMAAEIHEDLCSGCKICVGVCWYKAIAYDDSLNRVSINKTLCMGCGVCAAACPSGAIKAKHFSDLQISAEIKALAGGFLETHNSG
jgi:heterodisulfide reductase subunit A